MKFDKDQVIAVDGELEGLYEEELPEADQTFKVALQAVVQSLTYDLTLDRTLVGVAADNPRDRGLVEMFAGGEDGKRWKIALNWSPNWKGKVPPGYAWITYRGTEVAIIGPWATIRTCWHCGLKGWASKERKIGCCLPHYPCPHCKERDWFGRIVAPEDFERDMAEYIARDSNKDDMYDVFKPKVGVKTPAEPDHSTGQTNENPATDAGTFAA